MGARRVADRIPAAQEERAQLRAICARTLGFENHFLALYRHYALSELHGDDSLGAANWRLWRNGGFPWPMPKL